MTLWTTRALRQHLMRQSGGQERIHAAVCDLDAIGLQVHQFTCHLVMPCFCNSAHDTGVEARDAQCADQEYTQVTRGDQRRQELQRLFGIQSGTVTCNQVERGSQKVIFCLDKWAQVDPKESQEYLVCFGV